MKRLRGRKVERYGHKLCTASNWCGPLQVNAIL